MGWTPNEGAFNTVICERTTKGSNEPGGYANIIYDNQKANTHSDWHENRSLNQEDHSTTGRVPNPNAGTPFCKMAQNEGCGACINKAQVPTGTGRNQHALLPTMLDPLRRGRRPARVVQKDTTCTKHTDWYEGRTAKSCW